MPTYFIDDAGTQRDVDVSPVAGCDKPWVVVTDPGTDNEFEYGEYSTFAEALRVKRLHSGSADVMKRAPDGSLTTEY